MKLWEIKKDEMERRKWELATHGRADAGHYRRVGVLLSNTKLPYKYCTSQEKLLS